MENHEQHKEHAPEHHVEHHEHHEKKSMSEKLVRNPWIIASVVLGILVIILAINSFYSGMTGGVAGVSKDAAANVILDFANSQTGGGVTLVEVNEKYGLYEVVVSYQDEEIPLYITKDGKNLVQGVTPLSVFEDNSDSDTQSTPEVVKSDKPKVELFVMTHCPYGTQAEKGFIPMIKAMGSLIDAKIRFVHYKMHAPEEEETPRQVCIREEQPDKYLDYLECFLEDGNASRCIEEAGVNEDDLNECIDNGNADKYYEEDSGLSEGYGVQGSPTLVVNGQIVSSGRSPDAFLTTVCSAFNTAPSECSSLELSSENPSPGFGYTASGSATTASCG